MKQEEIQKIVTKLLERLNSEEEYDNKGCKDKISLVTYVRLLMLNIVLKMVNMQTMFLN